jgi:hypothetical protein
VQLKEVALHPFRPFVTVHIVRIRLFQFRVVIEKMSAFSVFRKDYWNGRKLVVVKTDVKSRCVDCQAIDEQKRAGIEL